MDHDLVALPWWVFALASALVAVALPVACALVGWGLWSLA